MPKFSDRLVHAWNAFMNKDPTFNRDTVGSYSYGYRPDRYRALRGNDRSMVTSVYNRIAMDCASIDIKHVRLDDNGRYISDYDSTLNECLSIEANVDQTGRAFRQDIVMSMLDEGVVAIVPVETSNNPSITSSYNILSMRTGRVVQWRPTYVRVELYNQLSGKREEIDMPKKLVALVENPLYAVMNDHNSTLQRLIRKLTLLDAIDEQSGSGKLDLIIQLPYSLRNETKRQQAEQRHQDIEDQISNSKLGIAYIDSTEHITQLNRPVENNLMKQIEYLTSTLYSQLGITQGILDGSADEKTMMNYYSRTIEPIMSAIVDEMKRKFLTKTARSQKQSIEFFRNPFKLVPVNDLAEIADKMTRNEIMSSNEFRQIIGLKPSDDPKADQLVNSNISQAKEDLEDTEAAEIQNGENATANEVSDEEYQKLMAQLDGADANISKLESML